MSGTTAARRYAKALFALAVEQKVVDSVHADLEALVSLMNESEDWNGFVESPFGSLEKRGELLENVLQNRVHELTLRFLGFLDRKHRMTLLAPIQGEWQALFDESRNIVRAKVVTASPLDDAQTETLKDKLAARFGKTVILETDIDAGLIGGMKIYIGDHVFDYSIESQLQNLRKQMIYA